MPEDNACNGKIAYETKEEATAALLAFLKGKAGGNRRRMQTYKCSQCGAFHMGHGSAKPRSARPRRLQSRQGK